MQASLENQINFIVSKIDIGQILAIFLTIVFIVFIYEILRMVKTIIIGQYLTRKTSSLGPIIEQNNSNNAQDKILIVGDSTAVGTGAQNKNDSISGRFAQDFPDTKIVNVGINGSLTRDAIKQLNQMEDETFNMIIISTGGNDIWHFSNLKKLQQDIETVLKLAIGMSNHRVILLLYNNIWDAPGFSFLVRGFLKRRGKKVQDIFMNISHRERVAYIELFTQEENNPFLDPYRQQFLFAKDGIHPSGDGYGLWYNRMWLKMVRDGYRS